MGGPFGCGKTEARRPSPEESCPGDEGENSRCRGPMPEEMSDEEVGVYAGATALDRTKL